MDIKFLEGREVNTPYPLLEIHPGDDIGKTHALITNLMNTAKVQGIRFRVIDEYSSPHTEYKTFTPVVLGAYLYSRDLVDANIIIYRAPASNPEYYGAITVTKYGCKVFSNIFGPHKSTFEQSFWWGNHERTGLNEEIFKQLSHLSPDLVGHRLSYSYHSGPEGANRRNLIIWKVEKI